MPPSVAAASNQMGKCKRNLEISVWNINKQIYEKYEMWAPELIPVLCSREIPMKGRQRKKEANEREKNIFSLLQWCLCVRLLHSFFSQSLTQTTDFRSIPWRKWYTFIRLYLLHKAIEITENWSLSKVLHTSIYFFFSTLSYVTWKLCVCMCGFSYYYYT